MLKKSLLAAALIIGSAVPAFAMEQVRTISCGSAYVGKFAYVQIYQQDDGSFRADYHADRSDRYKTTASYNVRLKEHLLNRIWFEGEGFELVAAPSRSAIPHNALYKLKIEDQTIFQNGIWANLTGSDSIDDDKGIIYCDVNSDYTDYYMAPGKF